MPNLYALIVACGQYPDPRHRLRGCAADFENIDELLERQAALRGMTYQPLRLKDEQATRAAIIEGFDHFKAAGQDDYCVFYFSGHGSFVPVANVFFNDSSGRNESLVCHDSRTPGGRDLMDKELAYLAHRSMSAGQPSFVTILDCCHSGSNFRSLDDAQNDLIMDRQTSPSGAVAIEDYLGYADYADIDGQKIPPRYPAVHLAACRPDERAQERPIGGVPQGVFTYCLARELALADPQLSLAELMRRVNIRANTVNPKQFPYLETYGDNDGNAPLFTSDAAASSLEHRFQIHFREGNWFVDGGSMQNIHRGTQEQPTVFQDDHGNAWHVTTTEAHRSRVEAQAFQPDRGTIYSVTLSSNGREKLKIALSKELPTDWQKVVRALAPEFPNIEVIDTGEETAAYRIDALGKAIILVRPDEATPLFKRVSLFDEAGRTAAVRDFLSQVDRVARWEAVLALNNPATRIPERDIEIRVEVLDGHPDPLVVTDPREPVMLRYHLEQEQEIPPTIKLSVRNKSARTYYVSGLQSSSDFGISNELMQWEELAPGQVFHLGYPDPDGGPDPLIGTYVDDKYLEWGVTEVTDHWRFVISTDHELSTNNFNQSVLALDSKESTRSGEETDRGMRPPPPRQQANDWTVRSIALTTVRPLHETRISDAYDEEIGSLTVKRAPKGFSAKLKLSSLETGSRSVRAALPPIFSGGIRLPLNDLTGERSLSQQMDALELTDIENPEAVSAANPLRINSGGQFAKNESIIPFGYDPESGAYYPLGYLDDAGDILIQDIPDEVVEERSLGGSVKIFFQKIIGKPLGVQLDYPLLRQVVENEAGTLVYADRDLAAIKKEIEAADVKRVVLFVHGIIGDTEASTALLQHIAKAQAEAFTDRYQVVLTFDYENLGTNIDETAKDLLKKLKDLGFGTHDKSLHLFAHSMGGLVSRWMIEKEGGDEIVEKLFTFGTPHDGSPWSNAMGMLTSAITYAISGATVAQPWLFALLGFERIWKKSQTTLEEMKPGGAFVKRLNDGAKAPIPYTLISGNTQLIHAAGEAKLRGFVARLIHRFRHNPHYALLDAGMFKGPNDIAVSLESQQNVNGDLVSKPAPIACDHLSYFNNANCIELMEGLTRAED